MTGTGGRGIRILDGAETAVAAARVAVSSAAGSGFRRGLAQTAPRFSLCSSPLVPSGSYRQARSSPISALTESAPEAFRVLEGRLRPGVRHLQACTSRRRCAPRQSPRTPGIKAHLATRMD